MVHTQRHESIVEEGTVGEKKGISGNEKKTREGMKVNGLQIQKCTCENVIMTQHCTEYVQLIYSNKKLKLQNTQDMAVEN